MVIHCKTHNKPAGALVCQDCMNELMARSDRNAEICLLERMIVRLRDEDTSWKDILLIHVGLTMAIKILLKECHELERLEKEDND